MNWIAFKMLTGSTVKFISIVLGVAIGALLSSQQASIFCGLMLLTVSQIRDVGAVDIWVMDPNVQFIDDIKPMSENNLYRVRGVPGVKWAVRFYKGLSRARLPEKGQYQQVILIGADDATMIGAPQEMIIGNIEDLRRPEAVIMDDAGFDQLWPGEPYSVGKTFEMNDRRAVLVGVCKARRTFQTFPIVYTRYSRAVGFIPPERKVMSFILAAPLEGHTTESVVADIQKQTGLQAKTTDDFSRQTMKYFMEKTGIPVNFGITVLLGVLVGTAVAGLMFYLFTVENLKQFGALKAMGATNGALIRMILLQASIVGFIGYGLGVGAAAGFGELMRGNPKIAFYMPWWVLVGTGVLVVIISFLSSLLSMVRVFRLEPAVVFQG